MRRGVMGTFFSAFDVLQTRPVVNDRQQFVKLHVKNIRENPYQVTGQPVIVAELTRQSRSQRSTSQNPALHGHF